MKKFICTILCVLTILLFVSCSKSSEIRVFEMRGAEFLSSAQHSIELDLKTETKEKVFISKEKSFDFGGEKLEAEYIETEIGYLYKEEVDYYRAQDNSVKLGINSDSGRIDYYRKMKPKNYLSEKTTSELSKEECIAVATEYLKTFVDISNYEVRYDKYWNSSTYGDYYTFEFHRMIDGIETSDSAIIEVTIFGDIFFHKFFSLGEMADAKLPSDKDMQTIRTKVEEKLKTIYGNVSDKYTVSYEIPDPVFVRLSDGKYAFEYDIDVSLAPHDNLDMPISELTKFLVYLD